MGTVSATVLNYRPIYNTSKEKNILGRGKPERDETYKAADVKKMGIKYENVHFGTCLFLLSTSL